MFNNRTNNQNMSFTPPVVTVITGCMFAGKTTELIEEIHDHDKNRPSENKLVVKPKRDDRYDADHIVSHNGDKYPATNISDLRDLYPILKALGLNGVKYIFIDEAHFFPELHEFLQSPEVHSRFITISGLNFDYQKKWFDGMKFALEMYAQKVINLRARCSKCGSNTAQYTARFDQDDGERIRVGGSNTYYACCERCHPNSKSQEPQMISIGLGSNAI